MDTRRGERILLWSSIAVCFLLAEFFLRLFHPQKTETQLLRDYPAMYSESTWVDYALTPGFVGRHRTSEFDTEIRLNSLGQRQREIDIEKGDQQRVLVIGDSFTFGWGVEEPQSYPRLVEAQLDGNTERRIEVVNAGFTGGFYPDAYFVYLGQNGLALEPDLVLIGMYIGNDIDGPAARTRVWEEVDENGLPLRVRSGSTETVDGRRVRREKSFRYRIPVLKNSHVAQLLYEGGKRIHRSFRPLRQQLKKIRLYETDYEGKTLENFERVKKLMIAMSELSRAHGAGFAVVMLPTREQVDPAPYESLEGLDFDKPQRIFSEFFAEHEIAYLDLLPAMRAATDGNTFYYIDDSHWNARGHAFAAQAIAAFLGREGLLGASGG